MSASSLGRICYVLSYKDPGYVRTRVLLKTLDLAGFRIYKAINQNKSALRYLETLGRLIYCRIRFKPQVYILGFRGHEILWLVRLITVGKPLIFDEFININDWLVNEHRKLQEQSFLNKCMRWYMKLGLLSCQKILTDTRLNAEFSARYYKIPKPRFEPLYVGTDEGLFRPHSSKLKQNQFTVFFYGTALPLHGIRTILVAAGKLKNQSAIKFKIIGGRGNPKLIAEIKQTLKQAQLTNVEYKEWEDFANLPNSIAAASLCLAGPFGNTSQGGRVITGKAFQYLAMAKPVVLGKINEDDGFVNKVNALVIKQGSVAALAQIIEWSYKNQPQLAKIGSAGRSLFEQKFSWQTLQPKVTAIVTDLI